MLLIPNEDEKVIASFFFRENNRFLKIGPWNYNTNMRL